MRYLSLFLFSISSLLSLAQNDTAVVSILPYYQPTHSDRPGLTFDANHLPSGVLIQTGVFGRRNGNLSHYGGNTKVRIGTCIGEFDVNYAQSIRSSVNGFTANDIFRNTAFTQRRKSLNLSYRYSINSRSGKSTLGVLAGLSLFNDFSQQVYNVIDRTNDSALYASYGSASTDYYGGFLYLNGKTKFNDHWGLASTLGFYSNYHFESGITNTVGIMTLNLGYSFGRYTVFIEPMATAINAGLSSQFQTGLSVNLSRDFTVDTFISVQEESGVLEHSTFNFGLTYFLR